MLSTPWSRGIGLQVPIVNAPMGGVAGGRLAAAVSAAGGLGMVGMGSDGSVASLTAELTHVTGRFGIGLVDWVLAEQPGLLEVALAARPMLLSVSFGADLSWVEHAHAVEICTATQVYSSAQARHARDAGVDVLVARGAEGGGHGEAGVATLPLLDAVLNEMSVPVLAAGGIASPRSLAAVLAAGASGAWLGTCLSACLEALTSDEARRALIAADETQTTATRVFDIGRQRPWPARFPSRVLNNAYLARWTGREDALAADPAGQAELSAGVAAGNTGIAPVDAGQGVAMVNAVAPAAQVIAELCGGAERLLTGWGDPPTVTLA
jgi:nitronate monooxygenase